MLQIFYEVIACEDGYISSDSGAECLTSERDRRTDIVTGTDAVMV